MGATSTLLSTIVYCMLPGCKGWHANLTGWHQKRSKNKPSPTGISNPIAETYIPGCENRVQMEPVCSVDSLSKGMIGRVLLIRCWDTGYGC